ncbi:MAG TPA: hypothetical protein VGJ29_14965 [Vicinamibacterales bacterium]
MAPVRLPLADVDALLAIVSNAPLDSSSLDAKPITAPFQGTQAFESEQVPKVTINLRAGVEISLFNSLDDKDPDGILIPPGAKDAIGGAQPSVVLSADRAWLKYRIDSGLTASAATTLAQIGFDLAVETGASATLADYRVHQRSQSVREALVGDLAAGPRFAMVLSDVETLAPGDAVSVQLGGTLKVNVTLTWADVFTGELAPLSALLNSTALIALRFDAGATVTANVKVDDDFLVVFSRADEATWRVGVHKADRRSIGAEVRAGIDVSFASPAAVTAVLDGVVDGVLAAPMAQVQSVLNKATLANLNDTERALAKSIIGRLGLDAITATLDDLRKRVDDVKQKVADTIAEVAKSKISLAFAYEYQRVSTSVDLLQATLSRERLRELHDALIRGNLQPALTAIREARPGIVLEQYLNEKTVERTASWGFTLGIGKWATLGGTDTRTIMPVVRRDIRDERQESYLGLRAYQGNWIGETFKWSADFNAEMTGFAERPEVPQFSFGIHLLWQQTISRLSENDVDVLLDAAILWGVMTQLEAADVRGRLVERVGRACDATVQMMVADTARKPTLRSVLTSLTSAPSVAAALGAAMPWRAGSIGRTLVATRRNLYAPLWQMYLDAPDMSPSLLAASADQALAGGGFADLGHLESEFQTVRPFTFAGLAELNGDTPARAKGFRQALETLRSAIDNAAPSQPTLGSVFHDLSAFWEQSHHVRAAGAYLLEAARTARVLDEVNRTLTFTVDGATLVLG